MYVYIFIYTYVINTKSINNYRELQFLTRIQLFIGISKNKIYDKMFVFNSKCIPTNSTTYKKYIIFPSRFMKNYYKQEDAIKTIK